MNTLYARQQALSVPNTLFIVGCGGVGSWAALIATLAGVNTIILADYDRIEDHNLNRIPLPLSTVNTPKATALKELLRSLRPDATIIALNTRVEEPALKAVRYQYIIDAIIDCTDNFNTQKLLYDFAKRENIPYIKAGCDLNSVTVHTHVPEWGEAQDGYDIIPSWAGTAAIAGALAIAQTLGEHISITTPKEAAYA